MSVRARGENNSKYKIRKVLTRIAKRRSEKSSCSCDANNATEQCEAKMANANINHIDHICCVAAFVARSRCSHQTFAFLICHHSNKWMECWIKCHSKIDYFIFDCRTTKARPCSKSFGKALQLVFINIHCAARMQYKWMRINQCHGQNNNNDKNKSENISLCNYYTMTVFASRLPNI